MMDVFDYFILALLFGGVILSLWRIGKSLRDIASSLSSLKGGSE